MPPESREFVHSCLRSTILHELVAAGDDGLTDSELAQRLRANKNHVPTRRRDVELNGLCRKTTKTRKTDTGSSAVVHIATPAGIEFAQSGRPVPSRPDSGGRNDRKHLPSAVQVIQMRDGHPIRSFSSDTDRTEDGGLKIAFQESADMVIRPGDQFVVTAA